MSKVKVSEKDQKVKRVTVKERRSLDKNQRLKGAMYTVLEAEKHPLVAVSEYKPIPVRHGNVFVGLRFDDQLFQAENAENKETIKQVDRYSRFIDHVLDLQKDETDLADWSIAKAAHRRNK